MFKIQFKFNFQITIFQFWAISKIVAYILLRLLYIPFHRLLCQVNIIYFNLARHRHNCKSVINKRFLLTSGI